MNMAGIVWTESKIQRFEIVYNRAVKEGLDQFKFEGNVFVVGYAKYLLEWLKTRI